jgi:hypothetical protein
VTFKRDANGTPLVAHPTRRTKDGTPAQVRYSRPSSFTKQIENTYNLQKWSERNVVTGIAHALHHPLESQRVEAMLEAIRYPGDNPAAGDIAADTVIVTAKQFANASLAADRGTWVHALTELVDDENADIDQAFLLQGARLGIDADTVDRLVAAWEQSRARYGLDILAVELPVVNDEFATAGTCDRVVRLRSTLRFLTADSEIVELPAGTVCVLDLKTGEMKSLAWWNAYAAQIYLYADSCGYDTATDSRLAHPWPVNTRWGLLAHLDVKAAIAGADDIANLYLVDLHTGRTACEIAAAAKAWSTQAGVFHQLYEIAEPVDAPPTTGQPPAGDDTPSSRPGGHLTPAQQVAVVPTPDDRADTRTAKDWVDLEHRYVQLNATGKELMKMLMRESMQAGVSWHKKELTSDRRWHLYDAAIALAEQRLDLDCATEALRALIAYAIDADWPLYPSLTCGHIFGALNAREAAAVAAAVRALDNGEFVADISRDVLELKRAA